MPDTLQSVFDLPEVSFIDNDTVDAMMNRMVSNFENKYKEVTGKSRSLAPADPMRILIYSVALDLYQLEMYTDRAGKQDLLKYSYGEFLDNLGGNRGVIRQQPKAATTTIRFTLSEPRGYAIGIPAGTRVTNGDGVYFATSEYGEVEAGKESVDIRATCTVEGITGNGYMPGQISTIVDPVAYVESVSNVTESGGGANLETDESLAERIFLAPDSESTAGSEGSYIYWAKTYSTEVGDVVPFSPEPCKVVIYALMKDGTLPSSGFLKGLQESLNSKTIRPITDNVTCSAPAVQTFNVDVTYYINRSDMAQAATIQNEVTEAVNAYVLWQRSDIGKDINPSELEHRIRAAGAKRAVIRSPAFTVVSTTEAAQPGTVNIVYGGLEDD